MSIARPPSESTRNSVTAVSATTSASSLQLSRRSDDRERARWYASFALAADFNYRSTCLCLGLAGRDVSWQALLTHLRHRVSGSGGGIGGGHREDLLTDRLAAARALSWCRQRRGTTARQRALQALLGTFWIEDATSGSREARDQRPTGT